MEKKRRDAGLDITRITAFFLVAFIHFFLHSEFYETPVQGKRMAFMILVLTFSTICVPLFMLLTGYLMSEKEIDMNPAGFWKHIKKLGKLLATYILSMIVIYVFRVRVLKEQIGLLSCLGSILRYDYYSWYVEMYIGLYLLIPFLNVLLKALNRKAQMALIIVMLLLTILPSAVNIYDINTAGAIRHPWLSVEYKMLVPDWWTGIYPLTYYFLGAYIRQNTDVKKLSSRKLAAALAAAVPIFSAFNMWRSYSTGFIMGIWTGWNSVQCMVEAMLVFLLINSIQYRKTGKVVSCVLAWISRLSFSAYLLSWIPDHYFYPRLVAAVPDMSQRFMHFIPAVGKTIVISLALAFCVDAIVSIIGCILKYVES